MIVATGVLVVAPAVARADGIPGRGRVAVEAEEPSLTRAELAQALFDETNRVREAHGRKALRLRRELAAAADDQAGFMALRMSVQHDSFLRGQATPMDRVQRRGLWIERGGVAENVAATSLGNRVEEFSAKKIAADLVRQWLNSPGHRTTMLDANATHVGAAVRLAKTLGGGWAAYGAQVFLVAGSRPGF